MKRTLTITAAIAAAVLGALNAQAPSARSVEILRDQWGIAHIFAESDADGFYGVGYATAEDRLVQMDLFRRRANGRLAEIYGPSLVASDRKFRIAGVPRHCREAADALPVGHLRLHGRRRDLRPPLRRGSRSNVQRLQTTRRPNRRRGSVEAARQRDRRQSRRRARIRNG